MCSVAIPGAQGALRLAARRGGVRFLLSGVYAACLGRRAGGRQGRCPGPQGVARRTRAAPASCFSLSLLRRRRTDTLCSAGLRRAGFGV